MKRSMLGAAVGLLLMLAACSTARRGEPVAPGLRAADATLQQGEKVFYQQCHLCHPHGQGGLGPALNNKPLPVFLMKFQVRHGLGAMPGFDESKIPEDELDALMAYLKALRANTPLPENVAKPGA